jgi:hypothetical protein
VDTKTFPCAHLVALRRPELLLELQKRATALSWNGNPHAAGFGDGAHVATRGVATANLVFLLRETKVVGVVVGEPRTILIEDASDLIVQSR